MTDEKNKSDLLALARTALAYERTLMAWIRTSISLISFGFTIYKFFEEFSKNEERDRILTPRLVGLIMIGFGFIALLLAQIQHNAAIRKLRTEYPAVQKSISSILSTLILVFGLMLFLGALFRQ